MSKSHPDAPTPWPTVDLTAMSPLEPLAVVPGMLFQGLNVIGGPPDCAKGLWLVDTAARTTTGADWGHCANTYPPADVVIVSGEDTPQHVLLPRLLAAGADVSRIHILSFREAIFSIKLDLDRLTATVDQFPETRLLMIDPMGSFTGQTDPDSDVKMRSDIWAPLTTMATERENPIGVAGIMHFNKAEERSLLYRFLGSIANVAAARMVWAFKRIEDRVTMTLVKGNLTSDRRGFAFNIEEAHVQGEEGPVSTARIRWESDRIAAGAGRPPTELERAVTFLLRTMNRVRRIRFTDLLALAHAAGISETTLRRARDILRDSIRVDQATDAKGQFQESWWVLVTPTRLRFTNPPPEFDHPGLKTREPHGHTPRGVRATGLTESKTP